MSFTDRLLRPLAKLAVRLLRRADRGERPPGAHAIAMTPAGRVILVRLRYAPGWRLPGGGRSSAETLEQAVLRELREEIGMTGHGAVRPVQGLGSVLVVEDVAYRPKRWSWEVEQIVEADPRSLPSGLSPRAAEWIDAAAQHI
jgi:8-oxo-dGTP pyrophosphatase MutT (NUDIX family)